MTGRNCRDAAELCWNDIRDAREIDEIREIAVELSRTADNVELHVGTPITRLRVEGLHVGPAIVQAGPDRVEVGGHQIERLADDDQHTDRADRIDIAGMAVLNRVSRLPSCSNATELRL
jgi:hypothetical protein